MKKVEYKVLGMTCTGCEGSVKRVVSRLAGVDSVDADYTKNLVVVTYDGEQTNDETIVSKISKLGYQVEVKSS